MKLLLGSNSPRRNDLLVKLGFTFDKIKIDCEETFDSKMPVREVAQFLAEKKSNAYSSLSDDEILITADTTVVKGDDILNKPKDAQEAYDMLSKLSGSEHQVVTGVCIRTHNKTESFSCETSVSIDELTNDEIWYYVNNYKPLDKAGAYGIQEWFGLAQVKSINGCYYNVVGLPCNEVYKRLKSGFDV